MKQANREYYDYWEHLNIRVELERAEIFFYETSQPVEPTNNIFPTLEEAKKYALGMLEEKEKKFLEKLALSKSKITTITEESQEFIGYNPEGGW